MPDMLHQLYLRLTFGDRAGESILCLFPALHNSQSGTKLSIITNATCSLAMPKKLRKVMKAWA
jgi:hypothetical protein